MDHKGKLSEREPAISSHCCWGERMKEEPSRGQAWSLSAWEVESGGVRWSKTNTDYLIFKARLCYIKGSRAKYYGLKVG